MLTKRSLSAPALTTLISLNSEISYASEDSLSSAFPVWPFFAIVFLIFIFRKQLNCVPRISLNQNSTQPTIPEKSPPPEKPVVEQKTTPTPEKKVIPEKTSEAVVASTETKADISKDIIDLKDNSLQCQASTAKGTRCKRKTTLEETTLSLNNKKYLLTVCTQHNNDHLKPYPGLIK